MKKIILWFIISLFLVNNWYWVYNQSDIQDCSINNPNFEWVWFPSKKLRVWQSVQFYDEFYNNSWNAVRIFSKSFKGQFLADSNIWGFTNANENFLFTPWIIGKKWIINTGERGIFMETQERYNINFAPATRNAKNLVMKYYIDYQPVDAKGILFGTRKTHLECQPYEITWCGDGIVDREYNETCDPNDPKKTNWWNGWCDRECKPVTKEPVCTWLTASKLTVAEWEQTTFTCSANYTDIYKIKVTNVNNPADVREFNGSVAQVTLPSGDYVAQCFVANKTTTEQSCVTPPITVTKPIIPSIKVDKRDANPADKDGNVWNDTQTIDETVWTPAVFKITVRNDGTEDLKDISLVDDVIDLPNDAPQCDRSIDQVNNILQAKFGRTYLKPGEIFDYTCERPNMANEPESYVNKIIVDGTGKVSLKKVRHDDPTKVNKSKNPKIKVDKRDSNPADKDGNIWNDTQTITEGKAIFKITVRNNWNEDLVNVFLRDDVRNEGNVDNPNDAPSCEMDWNNVKNILRTIWNKDEIFNIGEEFSYTCERQNFTWDTNPYTNIIKVEGTWLTSKKVVKDEDPTVVKKEKDKDNNKPDPKEPNHPSKPDPKEPNNPSTPDPKKPNNPSTPNETDWKPPLPPKSNSCINLKIDKTAKTFECTGKWTWFKVITRDTRGNILKELTDSNVSNIFKWNIDLTNAETVECLNVNDITANGSCKVNLIDGRPPVPSTPNEPGKPPRPTDGGWKPPKPNDGGWSNGYCGDWKVQYPNKKWQYEECDAWSKNGKNSWCSEECKLNWPETFPGEEYFEFGPRVKNIIGKGMNPYTTYNTLPYVKNKNKDKGSIYIGQICITNKSKFSTWTSFNTFTHCQNIEKPLNPGETITMDKSILEAVKAKNINWTQEDNILVTTISTIPKGKSGMRTYENTAFLSSARNFVARVAKGSVISKWGWVSYVAEKNNEKISNVEKVSENIKEAKNNKNFTWTSLSDFLSSYARNIDLKGNEKVKDLVNKETNVSDNKFNNSNNKSEKTNIIVSDFNEFKQYNWVAWAYILKNKNFNYNTSLPEKGPVTYIIENGDLTISTNVTYKENIAFVVKNWNIKFTKDITRANGTYIIIWNGKITSEQTANQLVINGALYGDISELTENRTYMKLNSNGQVDVWTIVSYGSSVFRKPAPLVSSFIDEYIKATKVAK